MISFDNIVFMKFGYHAEENEYNIIRRKQLEFENAGKVFWGYGGIICHPLRQVQPFVRYFNEQNSKVYLVMSFTPSKPLNAGTHAEEYSVDGVNWNKLPRGINVIGSKFAIVCSKLFTIKEKINLYEYNIAIGQSEGKNASDYISYRVDKGCLLKNANSKQNKSNIKDIELYAEIVYPYAVFIR
jgi:hypothetical protein